MIALAVALAGFASRANAACPSTSCTVGGTEYCCDRICTGGTCNYSYSNVASCDTVGVAATPGTLDGVCTVCIANAGGATVNGGGADETICGGSGPDVIDGRGGNDKIFGFADDDQITGGNGNDQIDGGDGDDVMTGDAGDDIIVDIYGSSYIDGGSGSDIIVTNDGDDEIYGGSGADNIINGSGADWVDSGPDNDAISTILFPGLFGSHDLGATYCGNTGDDSIHAYGGGHTCIDGGAGTDSCEYDFNVNRTETAQDVATAINCETMTGISSARTPKCGCP